MNTAHTRFLRLWAVYKPDAAVTTTTTPTPHGKSAMSSFDDAIDNILDAGGHTVEVEDEYDG